MNKPQAFSLISEYYDIIYSNKRYEKECNFIRSVIRKYVKFREISILDIGCGTAEHLLYLSKFGYTTTGIDISKQMLSCAKRKVAKSVKHIILRLGSATDINIDRKFSVVLSLFHVVSYLTTTEDLIKFFSEVFSHLKNGGVCVFDCWYGPGVLMDQPKKVISFYHKKGVRIKRIKRPVLDSSTNTVTVTHDLLVSNGKQKKMKIIEVHKLRYFFYPEIVFYANLCGLQILEWGTGETHRLESKQPNWNATFILAKKV